MCISDTVEPLHFRHEFARMVTQLVESDAGFSFTREMAVVYVGMVDQHGLGENVYTLRLVQEGRPDEPIDDGTRRIFANSEADDGLKAATMMRYFKTAEPEDERFRALSERVRRLKECGRWSVQDI